MEIESLKNFLRNNKIKPNFTYGQNFLVDDEVLEEIVEAAGVTAEDVVVEIGPGIGNLTRLLCEKAGFVLSVEKDPQFQEILYKIKKDHRDNFRYEIADALTLDYQTALNKLTQRDIGVPISDRSLSYKLVANIPYYITGKILQMFLNAKHKPTEIVVLTQKEVAENVVALAGDLSVLAISVQLFVEPSIVKIVPAKSFFPAPKVDSAILKIKLFKEPKYKLSDEKKFFKIVKACFAGKRKQLHNTLTSNLKIPKEKVLEILSNLKINPMARPQELTIEKWIELSETIKKND
jgi:16S rRNA (adenine1518-N6/adenine1519-N6)-dimethyltransferase